ncbi:glycosyltransferase family 9 protein, partial [candidate division FCPU426 bacterium]|nr:glycosyltransferase family 9 protein [candidate division FCPU426 bacterium]
IEFNAYDKVGGLEKMRRAWRVVQEIRRRRYDLALVLHRTPLAGMLTALAGVPIRIGFDWEGGGFALTEGVPFRADAHEIDRHMDCLQPLDIHTRELQPELHPPSTAVKAAEAFLQPHHIDPRGGPLVAVFPAGGINPGTIMVTKRWSLAGYQEVCSGLVRNYKARILLVGNSDDVLIGDALLADQWWAASAIRSEGGTSLMLLAALLQRCTLFIGGDSGPLHIADAVGLPTVSIYGPTDPRLLAPRGEWHRVIHKPQPCSPCYNPITVRTRKATVCRQKDTVCMESITSQEVLAAAEELLGRKGYQR